MNKNANISKVIIAGITGTIGMTLFMMMGNLMGLNMNVLKMLASVLGGNIVVGWGMHFMVGITLATIYEYIFLTKINIANPIVRGAIYAMIPWLLAQTVVMPMMSKMNGMGFSNGLFSGSLFLAGASLVAHFVFGGIVGVVTKNDRAIAPVVEANKVQA